MPDSTTYFLFVMQTNSRQGGAWGGEPCIMQPPRFDPTHNTCLVNKPPAPRATKMLAWIIDIQIPISWQATEESCAKSFCNLFYYLACFLVRLLSPLRCLRKKTEFARRLVEKPTRKRQQRRVMRWWWLHVRTHGSCWSKQRRIINGLADFETCMPRRRTDPSSLTKKAKGV